MIPDASKLLPFLPPMDKKLVWEILMGLSAFSFWVFILWFMFIADRVEAGDVAEVDEKIMMLILSEKEERISDRHRDFCRATQGSEQANYFLQRRNALIREYNDIAQENFDAGTLAPCEVLRPQEERTE